MDHTLIPRDRLSILTLTLSLKYQDVPFDTTKIIFDCTSSKYVSGYIHGIEKNLTLSRYYGFVPRSDPYSFDIDHQYIISAEALEAIPAPFFIGWHYLSGIAKDQLFGV